jgi:hypothetical protein
MRALITGHGEIGAGHPAVAVSQSRHTRARPEDEAIPRRRRRFEQVPRPEEMDLAVRQHPPTERQIPDGAPLDGQHVFQAIRYCAPGPGRGGRIGCDLQRIFGRRVRFLPLVRRHRVPALELGRPRAIVGPEHAWPPTSNESAALGRSPATGRKYRSIAAK